MKAFFENPALLIGVPLLTLGLSGGLLVLTTMLVSWIHGAEG